MTKIDTETKNTKMKLFDGASATDVSTACYVLNQILKIWLNITDSHTVSQLMMVQDVRPCVRAASQVSINDVDCVDIVHFISFNFKLH